MTYLFVPVKSKISCDLVYCSVIFGLVVSVNFIHVIDQFCRISSTDVVLLCSSMRIGHVMWIVLGKLWGSKYSELDIWRYLC